MNEKEYIKQLDILLEMVIDVKDFTEKLLEDEFIIDYEMLLKDGIHKNLKQIIHDINTEKILKRYKGDTNE